MSAVWEMRGAATARRTGLDTAADPANHASFLEADGVEGIDCRNASEVVASIRTSSPSQSAGIVIAFYDEDDELLTISDEETLTSSGELFIANDGDGATPSDDDAENPRYLSPSVSFDVPGAAKFRLWYVDAVTEGTCDLFAGVRG